MKRNDKSRLLFLLLIGLLGAMLAGCSPKSPEVSYYSLFTTRAVKPGVAKDAAMVLAIGPVTAPDILRRSQIATGSGAGRYRLSDYHRWAGDVEKDFARALVELLGSRPGGGQVVLYPGVGEATCQLVVDILAMEGDLGAGGAARGPPPPPPPLTKSSSGMPPSPLSQVMFFSPSGFWSWSLASPGPFRQAAS